MEPPVTRNILAIATALLAATVLFASAAEACISCEYVPEVVRGSQTSDAPRSYERERSYSVEREQSARPARHVVRSEPVAKSVAKSVDTADEAPVKKQANNENSSISVSAAAVPVTQTAKVEPKAIRSENSSISVAFTEVAPAAKTAVAEQAKEVAAKPVDCKKFFPSVGLTLTVSCD